MSTVRRHAVCPSSCKGRAPVCVRGARLTGRRRHATLAGDSGAGRVRGVSPAHRMSRERWMALLFGIGSTCFLVGPFPGYAQLVGAATVGVTFFVGSIFFTGGGLLQSSLAFPARREPGGRADWRAAVIQSAGTLFFNVTTFQAMDTTLSNADYNRLVW